MALGRLTGFYHVLVLVGDYKFIHKIGIIPAEGDRLDIEDL